MVLRTSVDARLFRTALAIIVLIGVVALPLVFIPGIDDGYALPKTVALRILALVGGAAFLGYIAIGGPLDRSADAWVDLSLWFFVGLYVAATVASVDMGQSLAGEPFQYQGLVTMLAYVAAFFAARLSLGTPDGVRRLLIALAGTGGAVAAYALAQRAGLDPFWSGPIDERPISSIGQANNVGAYLDLVLVAVFGLWVGAGKRGRVALGVVGAVSVIALGLTLSRGGYLALAAVATIWLVPIARSRLTRRRSTIVALCVFAVIAVAVVFPAGRTTLTRVVDRALTTADASDGSIHRHLDLWRVGIEVAVNHPLLGTGPETFPIVYRPYLDVLPHDRAVKLARLRAESPHNELIGLAAEAGLPAMLAFAAFLLAVAAIGLAATRRALTTDEITIPLIVVSVLAVHVVTTFFMTPETSTSALFWVLAGAGLAAIHRRRLARIPSGT
jgi:O-antigen ligase